MAIDTNNMSTEDLAKKLIDSVIDKLRREDEIKEINKQISFLDSVLYDRMDENDLDALEIDGVKITRVIDEQFQLDTGDPEEKWDDEDGHWFKYLEDIGEDGLIKIKRSVHNKTREKFLKELREQGQSLPDFIKVNFWKHCKYNNAELKRRASGGDK